MSEHLLIIPVHLNYSHQQRGLEILDENSNKNTINVRKYEVYWGQLCISIRGKFTSQMQPTPSLLSASYIAEKQDCLFTLGVSANLIVEHNTVIPLCWQNGGF